jgi:hypothetical protein
MAPQVPAEMAVGPRGTALPQPFDERNQLTPGALGKQPVAHFPLPRARPVIQGVVENGYALVFFGCSLRRSEPSRLVSSCYG